MQGQAYRYTAGVRNGTPAYRYTVMQARTGAPLHHRRTLGSWTYHRGQARMAGQPPSRHGRGRSEAGRAAYLGRQAASRAGRPQASRAGRLAGRLASHRPTWAVKKLAGRAGRKLAGPAGWQATGLPGPSRSYSCRAGRPLASCSSRHKLVSRLVSRGGAHARDQTGSGSLPVCLSA
jgi:hypothetical protein